MCLNKKITNAVILIPKDGNTCFGNVIRAAKNTYVTKRRYSVYSVHSTSNGGLYQKADR